MKTIPLIRPLPRIVAAFLLALGTCATSWAEEAAKAETEKTPTITAPKLLRRVAPVVQGTEALGLGTARFLLRATIDVEGRVLDARVIESEAPDLDKKIAAALGSWRFAPATRDGKAVAIEVSIPLDVNFAKVGTALAKR